MKKRLALLTATVSLMAAAAPQNVQAADQYNFYPYQLERFADIEDGTLPVDMNLDGKFDYYDIAELADFELAYRDTGYSEQLDKIADEDIRGQFSKTYSYLFSWIRYVDYENEAVDILCAYYLYKGSALPTSGELADIFAEYKDGTFVGTDTLDYVSERTEWVRYVMDARKALSEFPDWEIEIFDKIENGELDADFNSDGKVDYFDYYELTYYWLTQLSDVPAAEATPPEILANIEANGDLDGNRVIDTVDRIVIYEYYFVYKANPFPGTDVLKAEIEEYLSGSYHANVSADDMYNTLMSLPNAVDTQPEEEYLLGDANCDGILSIADATTIYQYLGNPDRHALSEQGKINADIYGDDGVTMRDAVEIQMMYAEHKIS